MRDEFGLYGYPYVRESFYMHERFDLDEELMRKFLFSDKAFDDPMLWLAAEPFTERIAEMNKWGLNGNIPSVITARPPKLRLITELWLSRNNVPYSNLLMGAGKSKGKLAWHIDAAFMIEDNIGEAENVVENGVKCYVIANKHNKNCNQSENLILVESYQEITERENL